MELNSNIGKYVKFLIKNADILEIIRSAKFQILYQEEIKENVEHHQILINYCKAMENFFSPILLPIMSFGLFYIIFIFFTVATTNNTSLFITFSEYFLCAVCQTYLMNYYGQELTTSVKFAK